MKLFLDKNRLISVRLTIFCCFGSEREEQSLRAVIGKKGDEEKKEVNDIGPACLAMARWLGTKREF
jgi:hypothetical protein